MNAIAVMVIAHTPKVAHFNEVGAGAEVGGAKVISFGAASAAIICSADILAIDIKFELFVSLVARAIIVKPDINSVFSAVRQSDVCLSAMNWMDSITPFGNVASEINAEFILGRSPRFEKPQHSCG